jgi:gliding motility-associated-like protein
VFEWSGCTGWSNPIASSSDLWCEDPIVGNNVPPQLGSSYQYPRTGSNMAGILINGGIIISYREFIQNQLITTLENGVIYNIEFYIAADGSGCFSNKYGVKFFNSQFEDLSKMWLSNIIPDAVNDESKFLTDTSLWQKIEMSYFANGTENFVIIGNFQDSISTTHTVPCDTTDWSDYWLGATLGGGYFFIDDVKIERASPTVEIPNVFTPNNDGINDFLIPKVINASEWEMHIMNRWGNVVVQLDQNNPIWDGANCKEGTYFYTINLEEQKTEQGFISIFRN